MAILNYTTTITATKTAGEMQAALAKHGADVVSVTYHDGQPAGLSFTIATEFGPRDFRLPANVAGVETVIKRQQDRGEIRGDQKFKGTDHARRVAWRILKDWLLAQLAVIESGLSTLDEVMLPYMLTSQGLPLIEAYRGSEAMRTAIGS